MAWKFQITDTFFIAGRGFVLTGETCDLVEVGPAVIIDPQGNKTDVFVRGVETFATCYRGQKRPYGALIRGELPIIAVDSWLESVDIEKCP